MALKKASTKTSVTISKAMKTSMKASNAKKIKSKISNVSTEKKVVKKNKIEANGVSKIVKKTSEGTTPQEIQACDGSSTTLFVSRLHHKLGFKQFKMHFDQFGKVTKAFLSETGLEHHNKGYGFITYETEQDMQKALNVQHELKGRVAEVKISQPKTKTQAKDATQNGSKKRKLEDETSAGPPSKKMCRPLKHEAFVGGLPADTSSDEVKKHFSQFGDVFNVFEPKKLDSKGLKYFFVGFKESSSLQAALEAKEHMINKTDALVKLKRKDGVNVDMPVKEKKVCSTGLPNVDVKSYERTVFVGNLDYATTVEKILEYFSKSGKVTGLTMPRHPRVSTQNKGYALVEFDTTVACQKALKRRLQKIDGKDIKVVQSKEPKLKQKKLGSGGGTEKYELFVADIPSSINNKALEIHFSRYGKLVSVHRPKSQVKRNLKFYAFVLFQTKEGLDAALADTNHKIAGEPLIVRVSKGEGKKKKSSDGNKKSEDTADSNVDMKDEDEVEDEDEEEDEDDEDEEDDDENEADSDE